MIHALGSRTWLVPLTFLVGMFLLLAGCGEKELDPRLKEGYDLVVQGKVDEAIALANALLADNPDNAEARVLIGLALYKAGDTEGAVDQYLQAIAIDPRDPEAHFNLANAYQMLGRLEEAEAEFLKAVDCQSRFVQAHYSLGILYRDAGRVEDALREFRACVDIEPQFYYAYLAMGQMQYGLGDMEGAVANLGRALELVPTQKELRVLYGNALMNSGGEGAHEKAENEFRAALGIDESYVDAMYNLAIALYAQGRHGEARVQFEQVLDKTREDPARGEMIANVNRFLKEIRLAQEDGAGAG